MSLWPVFRPDLHGMQINLSLPTIDIEFTLQRQKIQNNHQMFLNRRNNRRFYLYPLDVVYHVRAYTITISYR